MPSWVSGAGFLPTGLWPTGVGLLMAAEFVPAIAEVCDELGVTEAVATVGVSFGGLQAALVAVSLGHLATRWVLHSCAPSTLPFPDTRLEAAAGPLGFAPWVQRLTWRAIRAMTNSDTGLRRHHPVSTRAGTFYDAAVGGQDCAGFS